MEDKRREERRVEERRHRNQNRPQQQITAAFNNRDRSEKNRHPAAGTACQLRGSEETTSLANSP